MMNLTEPDYTRNAVERATKNARDWLSGSDEGHPRSWEQEAANSARRGYHLYEPDFEAPPIAGYEALEGDGMVERVGVVTARNEQRVHFRITPAGRAALKDEG